MRVSDNDLTPPALDSAWSVEMRFRPLNTVLSTEWADSSYAWSYHGAKNHLNLLIAKNEKDPDIILESIFIRYRATKSASFVRKRLLNLSPGGITEGIFPADQDRHRRSLQRTLQLEQADHGLRGRGPRSAVTPDWAQLIADLTRGGPSLPVRLWLGMALQAIA